MYIKIGAIIKKLRTNNNITQEQLATAVGVTPQAISRWEAEGGYPDIELLPLIAEFFSVSTDELLGYKKSEREECLAEIKKEMKRLYEVGTSEERVKFARTAISRYPADFEIKENLASSLCCLWSDTKNDDLLPEIENLALSVVDDCKDWDIRYDAIFLLVSVYADSDRPEKALEMTELLTPIKYCRETVKSACGIGDGKTEIYIQDEIDKLTDALGTTISELVLNDDLPNDPSTWDKKIEMMNISNELYKMIYGDNLMFYHVRLSFNYYIVSTYQMSQGKEGDALDSLESMCRHALAYDKSYRNDHGKYYTSVLTDKLVYPEPSKDFHEFTEHSQCYYMLERLKHKRYDSIRNNKRFVSIVETLSRGV